MASCRLASRRWPVGRRFACVVFLTALLAGGGDAWAIGDSGGCGLDTRYTDVLRYGSVAEVESYIAASIAQREKFIGWKQRLSFRMNPALRQAWRSDARSQLMHGKINCSIEFPLDHAVGNGNLEVVRWLLDAGVDPSATSKDGGHSIFTRCPDGTGGKAAGLSKDTFRQRQLDAYRMLIARGADINAIDPLLSIFGCKNREMHPVLRQLGVRVTEAAFKSWVSAARTGGNRINEVNWTVVEGLAKGQDFDFRGTAFEHDLLSSLDGRAGMPDHEEVVELTRRVSGVVRLSPGVGQERPASPAEVPGGFSPTRERCYFPEISAYPDFEFVGLWREPSSRPPSTQRDVTRVSVGKTRSPVLLVVLNNRPEPTTWVIKRSPDAQILGVIVLDNYGAQRGQQDALSFDPSRPAFLGEARWCAVSVLTRRDEPPRLAPSWRVNPASRKFDPFTLRGEPALTVSQADRFVVGELSPSSVLTSWPDSLRAKAPAPLK